ncbi:hypothetical protein [uncultured Sphingomonas sp.]|uniref:hypothetical protein n=1 Tax=uncultured Sphingomonas sp. TaxID=158754 RepID=UPI0035CA3791
MRPEAQQRERPLLDSDPAYNDLAAVFAPARNAKTHTRDLAAMPVKGRTTRGAVVSAFALVAMLAGLAGLAASHYAVTSVPVPRPAPASPIATPIAAKPQATPAPRPTPAVQAALPALIKLALSRPPSLPPVGPRPGPRTLSPPPLAFVEPPALVEPSRSQPTPHLTGLALKRALAQDVIDTRKLNMGVIRDLPVSPPAAATRQR